MDDFQQTNMTGRDNVRGANDSVESSSARPEPSKPAHEAGAIGTDAPIVVPVVAEFGHISAEPVEVGRVRIVKTVREDEETLDVPLMRENVEVQRVPVNEFVPEVPQVRYEGDTMIVPLVEEVLVIEKRLMLKEELHVTRRRTVEKTTQHVKLRTEEARVERVHPGQEQRSDSDDRAPNDRAGQVNPRDLEKQEDRAAPGTSVA